MPLTTTTMSAVIDKITNVIHGLTPTRLPDRRFDRSHPEFPLRAFSETDASEAMFRKFEVVRDGPREDSPLMDPSAAYITRVLRVSVAYPAKLVGLYGRDDLDDLEDLAEADATTIRDAIFSPGNLIPGCNGMLPEVQDLERGDPDVWFQDIGVRVHLFVAQTLT